MPDCSGLCSLPQGVARVDRNHGTSFDIYQSSVPFLSSTIEPVGLGTSHAGQVSEGIRIFYFWEHDL